MGLKVTRRQVLQGIAGAATASVATIGGYSIFQHFHLGPYSHIPCEIKGANSTLGHRLFHKDFPAPQSHQSINTVIIGGGIAGLSAARHLYKNQHTDFTVVELADQIGGNSIWGASSQSEYPWGAHYLPIPGQEQSYLFDFLQEAGIITGFQNGIPIFNEYYLCHDLSERLWINGKWQEGLIPKQGLRQKDTKEIEKFFQLMEIYTQMRGNDGKLAFSIPAKMSSQDPKFLNLDKFTMSQYMEEQGFSSPYLKWYVNYCCRDDYGAGVDSVSAWAGIHYFSSRRRLNSPGLEADSVLTWPEGNGFLVKKLTEPFVHNIKSGHLVYQVDEHKKGGFTILSYDDKMGLSQATHCQNIISAVPQFVASRLFSENTCHFPSIDSYTYAPWMVANLWVKDFPDMPGAQLAWDNVSYYSRSLGYIRSNHQKLGPAAEEVITYYMPLDDRDASSARHDAYKKSPQDWRDLILNDLSHFFPSPEKYVTKIDIWLWGHGMIVPNVGHLSRSLPVPKVNNLYFAHSDLSGISIFEEAFWQGLVAAKKILGNH